MKRSDISIERLEALESGLVETTTLVENLSINFSKLIQQGLPHISKEIVQYIDNDAGITARMVKVGQLLYQYDKSDDFLKILQNHTSDTIRGFGCYYIAANPALSLEQRLNLIKPFINDHHFGVREWSWLALRPYMINEPEKTLSLLQPWTQSTSAYIRRFTTEATRPRGVWTTHFSYFKDDPQKGLPLLEPLKADDTRYVQDSVANWLNDAAKTHGDWVKNLTKRWLNESDCKATHYICKRALRSLK